MNNLLHMMNSLDINELHKAVYENRLEAVKYLVKNGAEISNTINDGETPIYIAVKLQYNEILQELFKLKSREEVRFAINTKLHSGIGAVDLAAKNSLESLRLLLSHGAIFKIHDSCIRVYSRQTRQSLACEKSGIGLIHSLELIFESISSDVKFLRKDLNSCTDENSAATMYARNLSNYTLLQQAMSKKLLDAMAMIIEFRMEKLKQNEWQPGAELDKLMQHSKAARLHLSNCDASRYIDDDYGKKEILSLLQNSFSFLEACKEQLKDPGLVDQPLLVIIEEVLEYFGPQIPSRSCEYSRMGDRLLKNSGPETVLMLKLGIILPMQRFMQQVYSSELLDAAEKNDLAKVEKCLTGHPDLNKRDDVKDWTALHYAFEHSNNEMVKLLLNFGADPASESKRQPPTETPLHIISRQKSSPIPDIMQMLFERVSDDKLNDFINARAGENQVMALHLAAGIGNIEMMKLLSSKGSIYCAKDTHQRTPKDYSCVNRYETSRSVIYNWWYYIEQSFALAKDGMAKELVGKMSEMYRYTTSTLLAVGGARNDEGQTLDEIVELGGYIDEAEEIRKLLADAKRYNYFEV